jgi:hypothetical protein
MGARPNLIPMAGKRPLAECFEAGRTLVTLNDSDDTLRAIDGKTRGVRP